MVSPRHIIVKHVELHPEVKRRVREVLSFRENRSHILPSLFAGGLVGAAGGFFTDLFLKEMRNPEGLDLLARTWPPYVVGGAALAKAITYKVGSKPVRASTSDITGAIRRIGSFDTKGRFNVTALKSTHPFAFVNRRGDVVLVPKTVFQKALAASQQTFLKHVVPGRYRVKL